MDAQLEKKIERAIKLIQNASVLATKHNQPLEVCYSGGKDSDVILELVKMSGVKYRAIYKNTTIDPKGTIKHCHENGVEISRPKMNFLQILKKKGFPSRFARFCCSELKEYKILDYAILGIRADESPKRKQRYKEPEQCRVYNKNSKCRQYFPILDWTKDDVLNFIKERGIKLHPLYYNGDGTINIDKRLGCIGCPMAYVKHRIQEFKENPNLVKLYCRGGNFT